MGSVHSMLPNGMKWNPKPYLSCSCQASLHHLVHGPQTPPGHAPDGCQGRFWTGPGLQLKPHLGLWLGLLQWA